MMLAVTILAIVAMTNCQESNYEPVKVFELARHGARTSVHETIKEAIIPGYEYGELTPNGERMAYLLGKQIKLSYPGIFDKSFNVTHLEIRSSSKQRCVRSAISQILGILELGDGENITPNEKANPRFYTPPIDGFNSSLSGAYALEEGYEYHNSIILQPDMDFTFFPSYQLACPDLAKKVWATQQQLTDKYRSLGEGITNKLKAAGFDPIKLVGHDIYDTKDLFKMYDQMVTYENFYGKTFPGMTEDILKEMKLFGTLGFNSYLNEKDVRHIWNDNIARDIVKSFDENISGKSGNRFVLYSGHDSNLQAFSYILKRTSLDCVVNLIKGTESKEACDLFPSFLSNFIFELNKHKSSGKYFVRVLFENEPIKVCPDNTDVFYCKFDDFKDFMQNSVFYNKDDKMQVCGNQYFKSPAVQPVKRQLNTTGIVLIVISAVIVVGLVGQFIYMTVKNNNIEIPAETYSVVVE